MEQVLSVLGFEPSNRSESQSYGSCPVRESGTGRRRRSLSVIVAIGRYSWHRCGSRGKPLEWLAAATRLPLYQATIDLCRQLGQEVPWIRQ
jgi:hypothetical protein